MPISVITQCPKCKKSLEATGNYLEAVNLVTKEAWVIECIECRHIFLNGINDKLEE